MTLSCARFSLAAETIFMALVTWRVVLIDAIRLLNSFNPDMLQQIGSAHYQAEINTGQR
jgi:hypothetical protein